MNGNFIYWNGKKYYYNSKFRCKNFILPCNGKEEIEVYFRDTGAYKPPLIIASSYDLGPINAIIHYQNRVVNRNDFVNNIIECIEEGPVPEYVTKTNQQKGFHYWMEGDEQYCRKIPEEVYMGWFFYIIVMLGSLLFKEFYIAWIGASLIFWPWRNKKIKGRG